MTALLLALALAATPPAPVPVQQGKVFFYSKGVFAHVAQVRGMALAPLVAGYASTPDCGRVDAADPWVVYARIEGGPVRPYEVLDCSAPGDVPYQRRLGLILEVNYAVADDLAAAGHPRLLADGKTDATITGYERLAAPRRQARAVPPARQDPRRAEALEGAHARRDGGRWV